MNKLILTTDQAIGLLSNDERIHTFTQAGPAILGCDVDRNELIEIINKSECEIGGEQCKRMGHGLAVWNNGPMFIEVDKDKIEELEKQLTKP